MCRCGTTITSLPRSLQDDVPTIVVNLAPLCDMLEQYGENPSNSQLEREILLECYDIMLSLIRKISISYETLYFTFEQVFPYVSQPELIHKIRILLFYCYTLENE